MLRVYLSNSSIGYVDRILLGAYSAGQNEFGSNGNEEVLPKAPRLEPHHQIAYEESYYTADIQSVYSDWTIDELTNRFRLLIIKADYLALFLSSKRKQYLYF